ncbi:MAG: hypothetical protein J6386_19455 [Candidatus Synoicihabitans palmerolidicus]|nr:hypothetical protein [Candidatus Synoicihabitans palmerolidicus]
MCRNQEIFPVSASLFLRYLLFSNLLSLWDTLHVGFDGVGEVSNAGEAAIADTIDGEAAKEALH